MKLLKITKLSFNILIHSKLRSWLTILGIFIGVAAVVAIISLGQGLQQSVNSQISGLGQNLISISSGGGRAGFAGGGGGGGERAQTNVKELSDKDLQALKLVPNIKAVNAVVDGRATIQFNSQNTSASINGFDLSNFKDFVLASLSSGRYLTQTDSGTVVIGYRIANNVFSKPLSVGYILFINNKPFRVVGILQSSSGFGGSDNSIYMSTKDARNVLGSTLSLASNEYSSITVEVNDLNLINDTTNNIENALRVSHHVLVGKEDFTVTSAQALQSRFSSLTAGITLFLGVIAAVSLLVGGIGVANTMFTSVLEKTRDIGVMKAIGAKNSDILLIFLINSAMLGMVGGILGSAAAAGISVLVPSIGVRFGIGRGAISIPINLPLMIFAVLFSIALGMIFGALPAIRASRLRPVDALRYE